MDSAEGCYMKREYAEAYVKCGSKRAPALDDLSGGCGSVGFLKCLVWQLGSETVALSVQFYRSLL